MQDWCFHSYSSVLKYPSFRAQLGHFMTSSHWACDNISIRIMTTHGHVFNCMIQCAETLDWMCILIVVVRCIVMWHVLHQQFNHWSSEKLSRCSGTRTYIHICLFLQKLCYSCVHESCRQKHFIHKSNLSLPHVNSLQITCNTQSSMVRINCELIAAWVLDIQCQHMSQPHSSSEVAHQTWQLWFAQLQSSMPQLMSNHLF